MRKVIHGSAYFKDSNRILELMRHQCSATRSAYQAIHKHNLSGNDIKIYVKKNYMRLLNQRYIADSCCIASMINFEKSIFGGKKRWKNLQTKEITKEDWISSRNNSLYSRGDKSKNGNPNIRISEDKIFVNDPSTRGLWIEGKVFIPKKFRNWKSDCYDVRLIFKKGKFQFCISYEIEVPQIITYDKKYGVIGIDTNPDVLAISEVNNTGNLIKKVELKNNRISFASEAKRNNDIRNLAKDAVHFALNSGKPIVLEDLQFSKGKKSYKKFNRMKSNFCYAKLIEAIEARAMRFGVEVIYVNPAFTSILGNLKYKELYSLNRHTAASIVIARRGMGFKEKQTFQIEPADSKDKWNLEGRNWSEELTSKAVSYLGKCFIKPVLTAPKLTPTGNTLLVT